MCQLWVGSDNPCGSSEDRNRNSTWSHVLSSWKWEGRSEGGRERGREGGREGGRGWLRKRWSNRKGDFKKVDIKTRSYLLHK